MHWAFKLAFDGWMPSAYEKEEQKKKASNDVSNHRAAGKKRELGNHGACQSHFGPIGIAVFFWLYPFGACRAKEAEEQEEEKKKRRKEALKCTLGLVSGR
jgi:hypothetical protein